MAVTPSPGTGGSRIFVRRSTGLVREASALDATIFNAVFSAPVGATLAIGVLWALSAFPGADPVWATIIAVVINIPVLIMMALLASSMPRTGGDYVWVSRILSPPLAMISNFAAALSAMIGATFWARFFPVFALGPVLVGLGVLFDNQTLVEWGTSFQTDNLWIFLGGSGDDRRDDVDPHRRRQDHVPLAEHVLDHRHGRDVHRRSSPSWSATPPTSPRTSTS